MKSYLETLEEYNHQLVLENKKLARACNACSTCNEDDAAANTGQDNADQNTQTDQNAQEQNAQEQNAQNQSDGATPAGKTDDANNGSENSDGILVGEDNAEVHGNDGEVQSKPVASNVVVVEDDDEDEEDDTIEISGDNDDEIENDTVEIGDEDAEVVDGVISIVDDETEENDGDDIAVVDDEVDADENIEDAVPITDDVKQQIIDLGVETKESDCRFSIRFENEDDPNFAEALKILADAGITGAVAITDFGAYIAVAKECPEDADGDGAGVNGAEPADDKTVDGASEDNNAVEVSDAEPDGDDAEDNAPLDVTDDDDEESEDTLDESALLGGDLAEVAKQLAAMGSDEDEVAPAPAAKGDDIEIREARANERIKENILMTRKEFMKNNDKPIPESIQKMLKTKKKLFAGK